MKRAKEIFSRGLAKGLTKEKAIALSYPNTPEKWRNHTASKWEYDKEVKQRVIEILNYLPETSIENIVEGLAQDLKATKEVVSKDGIVEIKDNEMRAKAQEKLLKLHQAPGFGENKNQTTNNNLFINSEDIERLEIAMKKIKELNYVDNEPIQNGVVTIKVADE